MIAIVTWNIQAGRGVDGVTDLKRIARVVRAWGEPDVLCLQEVARHVSEIGAVDQVEILSALFPGHLAAFGAAVDRAGPSPGARRQRFGNLILSRLPVLAVFHHPLPQPADPTTRHMPRQAVEVVVEAPSGPLRIVTTHLEYHSQGQRLAQAARLLEIQAEIAANVRAPARSAPAGLYAAAARPARCVTCGDLNALPDDPVLRTLTGGADGTAFLDAWPLARGAAPHAPTCGVFDREQWEEGPHCRDYFLLTPDLAPAARGVEVNLDTAASDHQPVRLALDA